MRANHFFPRKRSTSPTLPESTTTTTPDNANMTQKKPQQKKLQQQQTKPQQKNPEQKKAATKKKQARAAAAAAQNDDGGDTEEEEEERLGLNDRAKQLVKQHNARVDAIVGQELVSEDVVMATSEGELQVSHRLTARTTTLLSCLLYTSPSPRDATLSRMPSSA